MKERIELSPQAFALVDEKTIARLIGRSRAWVQRHRDLLPRIRLGGGYRYSVSRVAQALQEMELAPVKRRRLRKRG